MLIIEELALSLKYSLMKDPCKRCLVRTMCSEQCIERTLYYNHTEGMPNFYRVVVLSVIISIVGSCVFIYRFISNFTTN